MNVFDVQNKDGVLVVTCNGQITFENTEELKKVVEEALGNEEHGHLVIDLSGVSFMDSSGIGTLVTLNSKVFGAKRRFYLMEPSPQVRKTLELVKLAEFFEFINGAEELALILSE